MSTPSKPRRSNLPTTGAQRIKAIVRKLPPNLPEELFWRSCELWVNDSTVKERWFMKGALKGPRFSSSSLLSRAYIAFKSPEELATFSRNYDGHIFRDKQGNEFSAVVEFAPSQKLPLANPKVDPRQGTIEDDEDYKSFLALLEKGENPSKEKATTQLVAGKSPIHPSKPESTPLLEALITSKKNASSSAQGGKFSKHKPQHQHASASKPQIKEDDAHFSRAQPIVPSGPVTLLTAAKSESSSKAGGPPTANNPTLSPALSTKMTIRTKETGVKGKGKGKPAATGEQPQESQSKPGKGKNTPKNQTHSKDAPNANVPGVVGEGGSKPKDDVSRKTPPPSKKKKPSPSPAPGGDSTQNKSKDLGGEMGEKANDGQVATGARERGLGRGRGGSGRGGVIIVPKILTKIISEGSAAAAAKGGPPSAATAATSTSEAPDTPPIVRISGGQAVSSALASETAGASITDAQTAGGGNADNDNDNGATPQSAPSSRGGERGRRPFYRGRGRGRGRGAGRGGSAASAAAS